ncbi:MAG TPA: hypothetical protein VGI39_14175 [Polyangiaceae bacterium]|jgi:hypothetical protein
MPAHSPFVRRSAFYAPLSVLVALCGCGSSTSSESAFDAGASSGGGDAAGQSDAPYLGGDDGSLLGGDGGTNASSGAPTTCIIGSQGCLCDSTGGCAGGLTCTPQTPPEPSLCCSGTNCASTGGSIGKSCSAGSGAASCTPGITIPTATGANDSCGYPATSFVESATICAINAVGGGTKPATIQVFYNDEHALTLGCGTSSAPVSPLSSDPDAVNYPETGDPACTDTVGRPLRPVLYVTDISDDATCTAGDQQQGGPAYNPIAVFGTWKSAAEGDGGVGTPAMMDPMQNSWDLTSSADPVPVAAKACTEKYSAELRFEVGLISGHSYRLQVIAHDGDQNKGGDSGEACAVFCAGSGTLCDPGVTLCGGGDAAQCPAGQTCVQGCCLSAPK